MAKFTASIILLAALCYIAEGVSIPEAVGEINIQSAELRVEELLKIIEAANNARANPATTHGQSACIGNDIALFFNDFNLALKAAEQKLRLELLSDFMRVTRLTLEQISPEIRQKLTEAVTPIVDRQIQHIKNCTS